MAPRTFRLDVYEFDGYLSLLPYIDGQPLTELIGEFETSHEYEPSAGYAGLVVGHYRFEDLGAHYFGNSDIGPGESGMAWVLGCVCSDVGCWPLEVQIDTDGTDVVWSHFGQPHRRGWDYSGFGPFTFDRAQYEHAVEEGVLALEEASKTRN